MSRPNTAWGHRREEEPEPADENGTSPSLNASLSSRSRMPRPKLRHVASASSLGKPRDVFLSTQFSQLAVAGNRHVAKDGSQAAPPISKRPTTPPSVRQNVTTRRRGKEPPVSPCLTRKSKAKADGPVLHPQTPGSTLQQILKQVEEAEFCCVSPYKSSKPQPPTRRDYLTKDSNLRNHEAFDVDGRLGNIEQQFDQLKGMLGDASQERQRLGEVTDTYKKRGKR